MKSSADIFDVIGLHLVIMNLIAGKSEIRFLATGIGWAFAHRLSNLFIIYLFIYSFI